MLLCQCCSLDNLSHFHKYRQNGILCLYLLFSRTSAVTCCVIFLFTPQVQALLDAYLLINTNLQWHRKAVKVQKAIEMQ